MEITTKKKKTILDRMSDTGHIHRYSRACNINELRHLYENPPGCKTLKRIAYLIKMFEIFLEFFYIFFELIMPIRACISKMLYELVYLANMSRKKQIIELFVIKFGLTPQRFQFPFGNAT